jgi:hypothetical protein
LALPASQVSGTTCFGVTCFAGFGHNMLERYLLRRFGHNMLERYLLRRFRAQHAFALPALQAM